MTDPAKRGHPTPGVLSREQILEDYRVKLCRALQGGEAMQDVCGLGIEALRRTIQDERDRLLKEHGHTIAPAG